MSPCATLRRHMTQTLNPPTADAKVVEGSDGLLLEIDGQIVPNYDATFAPFEEGDVVSGRVVRIDNDEVLVGVWMTRSRNVWRIEASRPRACSHSVGAAHALVWRSPTS